MHLKQPGFTNSACEPFNINRRYKKIFKAHFQHDVAFGDFKDLTRRTASGKVLRDKAFNIAKNPKYQRGLAIIIYKFFDKKTSGSGVKPMSNEQLGEELHKPITRKFKKYSHHSKIIFGVLI